MVNRIIIIILLFTSFTFAQQAQHLKADTTYIHGVLRFLGTGLTFQDIATGTNTTATMTVGTGGTLTYSGTGVVNANQLVGVTGIDATEAGYLNSAKLANFIGGNIQLRSNVIEENSTNGVTEIGMNYTGYNSGTTQFRNFVIYDGKQNQIVSFTGSTKATDFSGDVDMNGNDIYLTSSSQIFSSGDVDIRPAGGSGLAVGYNVGSAVDVNFFGGGTSAVVSFQENGAITTLSTIDATAYKVNGSVGTSGQVIVSDGSTGGVWGSPSISSLAFSAISTGTNTSATMTLGAGGTLTYTSTGVVNANQFRGVTSVDATEFGYLNNVSSAIQTQLDNKVGNPVSGTLYFSGAADIRAAVGQSVDLNYNQGSNAMYFWGGDTNVDFQVTGGGNGLFAGTLTTGAPTGGAGAWKLGIANSVTPSSPNRTITIDIGGTLYYLHAKTTND
jgi:hypothetical protein